MGKSMREGKFSHQKLKIEFHSSYLLMALGFILTGYYLNLIVFTTLILIHEMGHYLIAKLNHFHVSKIVIYPYGGMTKIEDMLNRDIQEELLIATAGVIFQYAFYLIIVLCNHQGLIRNYTMNLYTLYNNQMIFFNLLPIYPLDGAKILNLLLSKYLYYNLANMVTIIISILLILFLALLNIYQYNYSNLMIFVLLFTYLYQFYRKRKYLYHKFLLERYLYSIQYPKIKIVNNIRKMYKNKTHLFYQNHHYQKEKEVLSSLFKKSS